MSSFLTTKKMGPDLIGRIHSSVGGRPRGGTRTILSPTIVAVLRLLIFVLATGALVVLLINRKRQSEHLEEMRAELLLSLEEETVTLSDQDRKLTEIAEKQLEMASRNYQGDVISDELFDEGALGKLLDMPFVYVRGQVEDFKTAEGRKKAIASSLKDSFLVCLLDPPASEKEKDFLEQVYTAYRAGPLLEKATPHAHRLQAALVVMPLFEESWRNSLHHIEKLSDLRTMKKTFERAPLSQGKKAMRAKQLLLVADEAREAGAASEFDGATKHSVRVALVSLPAGKVLLRTRLEMDPQWISEKRRHRYAQGLLGCRLALDVHKSLSRDGEAIEADTKKPPKVEKIVPTLRE